MIILVLLTFLGLFCFENIPSTLIICGIIAQVIILTKFEKYFKHFFQIAHLSLLSSFPFFSATSPSFIVAVVMVFVNHYFAFSHFGENYYPFSEVTYSLCSRFLRVCIFLGDGILHNMHVACPLCILCLLISK